MKKKSKKYEIFEFELPEIPDEKILNVDEKGNDFLMLKILLPFENKYILIQPPTLEKYEHFRKDFFTLINILSLTTKDLQLISYDELKKPEEEIRDLIKTYSDKLYEVFFRKQSRKLYKKILKKYFIFKNRFGFGKNAITLHEFIKRVPIDIQFMVFSIIYNIEFFIKKKLQLKLNQITGMIQDSGMQSKNGETNSRLGQLVSSKPRFLESSSISLDKPKETTQSANNTKQETSDA